MDEIIPEPEPVPKTCRCWRRSCRQNL